MNLIKKTTLALGLIAAAGTSFAQNTAASTNGLLGQGYAEFNYTLSDIDSVSDHGHGAGVKLNAPLVAGLLDVGGSYTYNWIRGVTHAHANSFAAFANAYVPVEGVKPFVGALVGYSWVSAPFGLSDSDTAWSVSAGVEVPLGAFTFTPKVTYSDDFNGRVGNSDDSWRYEVEGHYWLTPKTGVFASVALDDAHREPIDVWNYSVGLRFKF